MGNTRLGQGDLFVEVLEESCLLQGFGRVKVTEGRTFRAAPGQNWRMISPVSTAAEHHSRTKL